MRRGRARHRESKLNKGTRVVVARLSIQSVGKQRSLLELSRKWLFIVRKSFLKHFTTKVMTRTRDERQPGKKVMFKMGEKLQFSHAPNVKICLDDRA